MKSVLLLSMSLLTSLKADLLVEIQPQNITAGVTRQLSINCTFIRTDITNMVKLISLIITRSNDTDSNHFYYLASVDVFDGLNNVTGAAAGLLDSRHESYITVTWKNPRSALAGAYNCEANGENLHGQTVAISKTADVYVMNPTLEHLLDVLEQQSSQLSKLHDDFQKIRSSFNEKCICCERFNKSLQSVYHISDLHNGRRYYLSPASKILLMKEAEGHCETMGGYLTEMDNEDEYLFVKNFVMNFNEYDGILIGGSDEVLENNWVNTYSKTPVKYIKWGQGQPSDGRSANCLGLWKSFGWAAADITCFESTTMKVFGYLCEVPE